MDVYDIACQLLSACTNSWDEVREQLTVQVLPVSVRTPYIRLREVH